jgi:hypothetical protein
MKNIDVYYDSLKRVHDQIEAWPEHKPSLRQRCVDWILGAAVVLLILCIVPIAPALLVFLGGQAGLVVASIDLSVATFSQFVVLWVGSALGTAAIVGVMLWVNNRVDSAAEKPEKPPQTLSPDQYAFVAAYEAYKELKVFFVSHIEQHVDRSLRALRRIVSPRMLWRRSPSGEGPHAVSPRHLDPECMEEEVVSREMYIRRYGRPRRPESSLEHQVYVAQEFLNTFDKYAWLRLEAPTKSTLQALISLPPKVYYRLLAKEDLPPVLAILENLSRFIYAFLPEHQAYMDAQALESLHEEGRKALAALVDQVNELAPLRPVVEEARRRGPELSQPGLKAKVSRLYAESVVFRFASWFVCILVLTSTLAFFAGMWLDLDDTAMVVVALGTAGTGAAALAALTPRPAAEPADKAGPADQSD